MGYEDYLDLASCFRMLLRADLSPGDISKGSIMLMHAMNSCTNSG